MDHDLLSGCLWYGAFLFSTVCHEAAHAWSALRLGDPTAARGGQVTLNPVPHIRREPMGMVLVPILSWLSGGWIIGWASAPYSVSWAREYPKRAALMALAGPATNLVLAISAGLLIRLGYESGLVGPPYRMTVSTLAVGAAGSPIALLASLLSILLSLNVLLCLFNMVPLPPLDGSSAPLLLLSPGAAQRYAEIMRHPALRLAGMVVAWRVIPPLLIPLLRVVAHLLYA